ncbi:MAG: aminopeptidase P family protein [Candidatus Neomarinimicrobiota bacterium]|nr:aminopeptidase P family protein [Candidatus Neomarinimicrobiota bacterium]
MSYNAARIEKLRHRLSEEGLVGMYVSNLTNVRYLSGFTGSAGNCFISEESAVFISDGRYDTQSRLQVLEMEIMISNDPHIKTLASKDVIAKGKIAFEGDEVSVNELEKISLAFSGCDWVATSQLIERIAMVKDESEIRATRTAVEIADAVFEQIVPDIRPGATEKEIAAKIPYACKVLGADAEAFEPIVASGANSALPHARPTEKEIESGDFVVLDFGAKIGGYHSDMTRTVVVGKATEKHREIYETVLEAQRRGCEIAVDGIACKAVDAACRDYIEEQGYGKYFNHGTGHGLGLQIHTNPRFSQLSDDSVSQNYLMTIEPGVYISEFGGVRIEDDVLIRKDDCEILNKSPKELMVLD